MTTSDERGAALEALGLRPCCDDCTCWEGAVSEESDQAERLLALMALTSSNRRRLGGADKEAPGAPGFTNVFDDLFGPFIPEGMRGRVTVVDANDLAVLFGGPRQAGAAELEMAERTGRPPRS